MHSNLCPAGVRTVTPSFNFVRLKDLILQRQAAAASQPDNEPDPYLRLQAQIADPSLTNCQRSIAQYCLKSLNEFHLPSELYRNSKSIRKAIDEEIRQDSKLMSGGVFFLPHRTRTIYRQQTGRFETVLSPSLVIADHCQFLEGWGVGEVVNGRYGISFDKSKAKPLDRIDQEVCFVGQWFQLISV